MEIIVPIKKFSDAKGRLQQLFSPHTRQRIAETLAMTVLGQLARSRAVRRVIVASSEPAMVRIAARFGFETLPDSPCSDGLNDVVARAVAHAIASGSTDVGVVFSDLPLFEIDEFDRIVRGHLDGSPRQITLVTDRFGSGTNIRLCRPGNLLPAMYGHDSANEYRKAAAVLGADVALVSSIRLSHDLDIPEDVQALLELPQFRKCPFLLRPLLQSRTVGFNGERPVVCA